MAAIVFSKILSAAVRAGTMRTATEKAGNWYRGKVTTTQKSPARQARWYQRATKGFRRKITRPAQQLDTNNDPTAPNRIKYEMVGNLYFFTYDPLGKKTLPYYDEFPLVMPFDVKADRIWGINFHYLPPIQRAVLMDNILNAFEDDNDDQRVLNRTKFSYESLEAIDSRYKYYRAAIKSYKFTQMRSRMLMLDEEEWKTALFLPVHRFVGAPAAKVWNESRKKNIKG